MHRVSVTRKKSPKVYKSCSKMISLPLQKLPNNVEDLGKLVVAKVLKSCPKSNKSPNQVTLITTVSTCLTVKLVWLLLQYLSLTYIILTNHAVKFKYNKAISRHVCQGCIGRGSKFTFQIFYN